jgi:hypothetical protein
MATYTVTLTDAEDKALRYVAFDPQDWIDNAVHNRCRQAVDQIYQEEVERMTADPDITSIPANKEQVVLDADIMSAADRQAQPAVDPPEVN